MEMAWNILVMGIAMLENMSMVCPMVMESIHGLINLTIKENLNRV